MSLVKLNPTNTWHNERLNKQAEIIANDLDITKQVRIQASTHHRWNIVLFDQAGNEFILKTNSKRGNKRINREFDNLNAVREFLQGISDDNFKRVLDNITF